ncbi:PREDICTED: solute carrier family 22 member 10-like [Condylura cristata]|uniref:solute carrier family 22 member 10-like n=1 Tax=Condylura cristata TaxID=143302 RepID=UPI000643952C|nr:PREDICTED: solute carrier family 22 member 10-like [Condylura cristata]
MAFEELLVQVGGLGKFQTLQMVLILPILMIIISHLLLENFTAATPDHRCWVHILDDTISANATETLSYDALLRISIPLDTNLRPEKCHRFVHPQWQLLHVNGTLPNRSEPHTEPCMDGWVYDQTYFPSTIVTEWHLVCGYQAYKSVAQTVFMAGMLVGGFVYGHLSDRQRESIVQRLLRHCSRQLAVSIMPTAAPQKQAVICDRAARGGHCAAKHEGTNLGICPSFVHCRFAITIPFYGIMVNLQHFGSNIFLLQVIFGALTVLARCLTLWALSQIGRRLTQTFTTLLLGLSILANTFVPPEMQTLRVTLACVGTSLSSAASSSFSIHLVELIPTILRARAAAMDAMAARCGATLAPLLMLLVVCHPTLPWIIYGVFPIPAGLLVLLLPETKNRPLPDTIQDVENQ